MSQIFNLGLSLFFFVFFWGGGVGGQSDAYST